MSRGYTSVTFRPNYRHTVLQSLSDQQLYAEQHLCIEQRLLLEQQQRLCGSSVSNDDSVTIAERQQTEPPERMLINDQQHVKVIRDNTHHRRHRKRHLYEHPLHTHTDQIDQQQQQQQRTVWRHRLMNQQRYYAEQLYLAQLRCAEHEQLLLTQQQQYWSTTKSMSLSNVCNPTDTTVRAANILTHLGDNSSTDS